MEDKTHANENNEVTTKSKGIHDSLVSLLVKEFREACKTCGIECFSIHFHEGYLPNFTFYDDLVSINYEPKYEKKYVYISDADDELSSNFITQEECKDAFILLSKLNAVLETYKETLDISTL